MGGGQLEVRDLTVSYAGAVSALRGVSMFVPEGSVVAVLGSNGAGKSTLLRAISGTLPLEGGAVDEGGLEFEGRDLEGMDPAASCAAASCRCPRAAGSSAS